MTPATESTKVVESFSFHAPPLPKSLILNLKVPRLFLIMLFVVRACAQTSIALQRFNDSRFQFATVRQRLTTHGNLLSPPDVSNGIQGAMDASVACYGNTPVALYSHGIPPFAWATFRVRVTCVSHGAVPSTAGSESTKEEGEKGKRRERRRKDSEREEVATAVLRNMC